jgi:hypothetical protein
MVITDLNPSSHVLKNQFLPNKLPMIFIHNVGAKHLIHD